MLKKKSCEDDMDDDALTGYQVRDIQCIKEEILSMLHNSLEDLMANEWSKYKEAELESSEVID